MPTDGMNDGAAVADSDGGPEMRAPSFLEVAIAAAERHGVCTHPVILEQTDTVTGRSQLVPVPCGATLESKCGPCARKARTLRKAQCREGWHLTEEPPTPYRARASSNRRCSSIGPR
jgi:hypothetical protein